MLHIISLGAGVQSSTIALMAAAGELGPMPDAAVFADTGSEPAAVYKWLPILTKWLPFPVYRVKKIYREKEVSLAAIACTVRTSARGINYTDGAIPAFIINPAGEQGIMQRQCTESFKIEVIRRELQRIRRVGRVSRRRALPRVMQWIGISTDEAHRMKDSGRKYIENRYPLIEKGMSRVDCLDWMSAKGYPEPPRSSCTFCPFHTDREWHQLKTEQPADFLQAVEFEKDYQAAMAQTSMTGRPFLHKSCVPLDKVVFTAGAGPNGFGNECAGVCGV